MRHETTNQYKYINGTSSEMLPMPGLRLNLLALRQKKIDGKVSTRTPAQTIMFS